MVNMATQHNTDEAKTTLIGNNVTQLIDPGTVLAFTEFAKDKDGDIVKLHFGEYLKFSCTAIEQLKEKINTSDYASVELLAQSLKSTSLLVGAHKLSLIFEKMENDARHKCLKQVDENALAQMVSLHAAVNQALVVIASNPDDWLHAACDSVDTVF